MAAVFEIDRSRRSRGTDAAIEVSHLTKAFYDGEGDRVTVAASDVNFTVTRGEFVCIVGPSGCGKTTVLRILADLEQQLSGTVRLHSGSPPAMVFQEASVLPWLTVSENIAFPLSLKGVTREKQNVRVRELLELTGLTDFANARPHQLSGGMKQRVSVARALVDDREILLMDEPFGALDEQTRLVLQQELLRIWEKTGKTVVFITHSVDEALTLADRVLVMSPRPGTIVADLAVPFERPRDVVEMRRDKRFWDLTYEVWRLLAAPART
ncbi:MAG: ABC transporter ATP-binding protein [Chelatococcus sp.]|uniref:ABC transporter ATP-binding protein n=1 Tax=unclassified Chelatococcus TaxID=2638111 RepID=UPI001BCACE3F|nr:MULTISPECIES: ABC transporter ATP-binding protein [unclassified Chelatococcus]CAH1658190.1 NitT/TauT family transport system ATP-binding protein [Hyphomicrobiales bacterium]MBS7742206.1 ABC transporter ATP-binding protein [Chelatococcus sp. HY11]MBX3539142.1 ABC transporter ATP-binding protein [Chelatococcus sp.]MBX3542676.1 ABC transporter ATP-binding protein [Chelatococcus sp.]MCO5075108.1 ABC transporter ATP-binding protein [Chelatococcus sp.]